MKIKKLVSIILVCVMVLGTMSAVAFAEESEAEKSVAKIGDNYFSSLADALNSAKDSDVIEFVSDNVIMPDNTVITKAISFKGNGKNVTTLKINSTVKIKSENVSFSDFKIDGSDVPSGYYTSVVYVGADNVSFTNVDFNDGPDGTYDSNVQVAVWGKNLQFKGCDFSGAFRGILFADCVCDTVIDGCTFFPDGYTFNVNTKTPETGSVGTILVKNSTLKGWTSWGDVVEQVIFENTKFEPGIYNTIVAYNNVTFKNCQFTKTEIESGNALNFKWIVDNCKMNGNVVRAAKNFFAKTNTDYKSQECKFIYDSNANVIETAKTTGATVTLNQLSANDGVDIDADATYKVVVTTAPAEDIKAANDKINAVGDTNSEKHTFDISVIKTDSEGSEKDVSGTITDQQVTLTLSETPVGGVRVYHVNNAGEVEEITPVTVNGNEVTFIAPSFSTYTATYNTGAVDESTITNKVGVVFSPAAEDSNEYYITLKALENGKKINRFMAADIAFKNNSTGVSYEITPAANINVNEVAENEYRFEMNGSSASSVSGDAITIGTVTFGGIGSVDFGVDEAYTGDHSVNIVNTAKSADNVVDHYDIAGGTLVVNDAANKTDYPTIADDESGKITADIKAETANLTVDVMFNNPVGNQAASYQDMKVVISGGDLAAEKTLAIGSDENAVEGGKATVTAELTKNIAYTVTVSGAGYRTARHTVTMTGDKTLKFWNNVLDTAAAVEEGKTPVTKNFLAGDIVKDNKINIYDLSAVVSYYGRMNVTTAADAYAKYDLNRDGVIDSKDVAMVLVSWGN